VVSGLALRTDFAVAAVVRAVGAAGAFIYKPKVKVRKKSILKFSKK